MKLYIFIYNVVYIKCNFNNLKDKLTNSKFVLIASPYCIKYLNDTNKYCFYKIHTISRNFQEINYFQIEKILLDYLNEFKAEDIRILSNEDSTQINCAKLREIYGIPGHNINMILPFVNKVVSKQKLENIVELPKFEKFDKIKYKKNKKAYLNHLINKLSFPIFIKPIDLVSSIETHFIPNLSSLKIIAEKILNHQYEFEADEFIKGELVHCDVIIINNEIKFFKVGKCSFPLARFFEGNPVGSIPIKDSEILDDLKNFCNKVLSKLKCYSGVYHLEAFMQNGTKKIIFLEVAARSGGALITKLYEKLYNINIEEINYLIQFKLIENLEISDNKLYGGFMNFPTIKGVVSNVTQPEIIIHNEFINYVSKGEIITQAENLLDISCSVIFWNECYQKVEQTFKYLKNYEPLVF